MKKIFLFILVSIFLLVGISFAGPTVHRTGVKIMAPLEIDHNVELLNADRAILTTDRPIQFFDANGADRNVTLPAEASSTDLVFTFYNDSDGAGEDLVIRDDTPTTLTTIGPGQGTRVSCDGTSWKIWYNGIYYDSIADIVKIQDRLDLTDGTNTSIIKHVNEPGLGGRLTFGLDETARTMVICDAGDVDADFGLGPGSHPALVFMDADLSHFSYIYNINGLHIDAYGANSVITLSHQRGFVSSMTSDASTGNVNTFSSEANREVTDTNGEQSWVYIEPKINQSGTAAYTGLKIKVTETALGDASTGDGGGTNNFILAGTSTDPNKFKVDNAGNITTKGTVRAGTPNSIEGAEIAMHEGIIESSATIESVGFSITNELVDETDGTEDVTARIYRMEAGILKMCAFFGQALIAAPSGNHAPAYGCRVIADRANWDPAGKGAGGAYWVWYDGDSWEVIDGQAN